MKSGRNNEVKKKNSLYQGYQGSRVRYKEVTVKGGRYNEGERQLGR